MHKMFVDLPIQYGCGYLITLKKADVENNALNFLLPVYPVPLPTQLQW